MVHCVCRIGSQDSTNSTQLDKSDIIPVMTAGESSCCRDRVWGSYNPSVVL